ncbi:hypothetical protein [Hymenobacter weizhouensis]|uniref:hypothetical protein n=1 Tax=Hymenobacter sp. YIM 151500-1 TaxID=2987689 RepID=UPI00222703EC|nr:hypothetical protein [Hymenobacter sp. YIM 151500-1]UYZ63610.1 hypothetical protein OIS53_01905 [Hymenobacter sp. YIM 151500-1]
MKHFYCLFTFLLFTFAAAAQGLPGYVITLSGDTLRGYVREKKNQQLVVYPNESNTTLVFRPAQLRGYGLRNQPLIKSYPVRLSTGHDSTRFVAPLQVGPVSLYSYADESGLLLRPAASDTLYELTPITWRLLFNRHLHGCSTLNHTSREIFDLSFSRTTIARLITRYNQCLDPTWKAVSTSERPMWRYGIGVHTGGQQLTPFKGKFWQPNQGTWQSWEAGFDWIAQRANGLQTVLSASYLHFAGKTSPYQAISTTGATVEQRGSGSSGVLLGNVQVTQRLGNPRRRLQPITGVGIGLGYMAWERSITEQRLPNSSSSFQTTAVDTDAGGAVFRVEALAGVLLPIGVRKDASVSVHYQYYYSAFQSIGLQIAYHLYK